MKTFSIVLPCYNEDENIDNLLNNIDRLKKIYNHLEIIVVENGSTDNSLDKIKNHNVYKNNSIILVELKKNLGYGHGIMAGVNIATGEYIGWCHADLQNNLDDVYSVFEKNLVQLENKKTVLKGRRKNRSIVDNFFTFGMSKLVGFLFKYRLTDINAQPKIFPKKFLTFLKDPPNDFSLDLYLLLIAKINSFEIVEYPLTVHKRIAGIAKGGGTLYTKIKLTFRTLNYIYNLKKNRKFKWK